MGAEFVPGLELSARFYTEVVADVVGDRRHGAALIGEGSEVLGFDTERSTDHGWGPRLQVFVPTDDDARRLHGELDDRLPERFEGWPVRYYNWRTDRVEHHVEVATLEAWLTNWLGFDPRNRMRTVDWLTTPQQLMLEVTSGAVYRDDLRELRTVRDQLQWYPHDVWLCLMASEWQLIAAVAGLLGRTAEVGDEIGSRLVAANIARAVIRLCFLQDRRYVPYAKWLGSAFARLPAWHEVGPPVNDLLAATTYEQGEAALVRALIAVGRRHNDLAVTSPVAVQPQHYGVLGGRALRPYLVVNAGEVSAACRDAIGDRRLHGLGHVGAVDQVLARTDQLVHLSDWPRRLATVYEEALTAARAT